MDHARAMRMAGELLNNTIGDWLATEYIDAGKSALVFKAQRGDEIGALKVFDPELIERYGKDVQKHRIWRELSLCGRHHPHLVKVLDGGECPRTRLFFIVMEFIEAPNLATIIEDVPREYIWLIISQLASAAQFLETLQLAHRDIKPDNVVVSLDFQRATLLDLGVIRPFGVTGLTDGEQRVFIGTLRYSSPEFLFRAEQDTPEGWRALTFYQLGAVLHDMVMRKRLFSEFSDPYARLVEAVGHQKPLIEAADVSAGLILLAKNALVKDPELRLRLVSWKDFQLPIPGPSLASEAKERIRKRRAHSEWAPVVADDDVDGEQKKRTLMRTLSEVQTSLQTTVRRECIGSNLFPPMEVVVSQEFGLNEAYVLVHFYPSTPHGLRLRLYVWLGVRLLDQPSVAVQICCCSALSSVQMDRRVFAERGGITIFEGVFEDSVIRGLVQHILYPVLDQAQDANAILTEPIWLDVQVPGGAGGENE